MWEIEACHWEPWISWLRARRRAQLTVPRVILHTTEPARYLAAAEAAGVPIVAKTDLVSAICAAVPIR